MGGSAIVQLELAGAVPYAHAVEAEGYFFQSSQMVGLRCGVQY
jgi:hypothetical protein